MNTNHYEWTITINGNPHIMDIILNGYQPMDSTCREGQTGQTCFPSDSVNHGVIWPAEKKHLPSGND